MAFNLNSQSPITSKIREQMYLKHLREVERISNRQADSLKKQLKQYRSITQIHRNNKKVANKMKNQGSFRDIRQKNEKIKQKIDSIDSDFSIKRSANNAISRTMSAITKPHQLSTDLPISTAADSSVASPISTPFSIPTIHRHQNPQQSLHSRYRRKQQMQIQQQNSKIFRAIENQKSKLMWLLGRDQVSNDIGRANKSETIRSSHKSQKQGKQKNDKFRQRLQRMQKSERLDRVDCRIQKKEKLKNQQVANVNQSEK